MQRRTFMAAMASLAGAGRFPRVLRGDPLVKTVGLQLYTVRSLMKEDVERTLARVAEIGYREVEFAGYFGHAPKELRGMLDKAGLSAPATHVDPKILAGDWNRTYADAKALGCEYVVVPWIPEEQRRTIDDWHRIAARCNRAGEAARHAGLTFAYHNHDFEFAPMEGKVPYDTLMDETDPRLVKLELDLFWCTKGGRDPLGLFARWPKRFRLVHVKDLTSDGRMVDVGAGVIDWKAIFDKRKQADIEHYFVEHDEPADPIWSATASYRYLSKDT